MGWQLDQLDHMEIICTSFQTDNNKQQTNNRFTALLEYVRDHPGEQVPER